MYYRHLYVSSQLVLVLLLSIRFATPVLAANYRLHIVAPPITNHMILNNGPLPPVCKEASAIEIAACRGEYDPASFVVSTSKPL